MERELQSLVGARMLTGMDTLPKAARDYLVAIGRRGGKARLVKMTADQRAEVARRGGAANAARIAAMPRKPGPA